MAKKQISIAYTTSHCTHFDIDEAELPDPLASYEEWYAKSQALAEKVRELMFARGMVFDEIKFIDGVEARETYYEAE